MKTMKLKGLFLCLVFLLCNATSHAADDLITRQITIKLDKAGTLPDKIGSSKKYKITNLKIVGEINGTDWRLIRDMASEDDYGRTKGKLSTLDLSEAKIVKGGSFYYNDYGSKTSNDVLGPYAFSDCPCLTNLTLPSGVTEIGDFAFRNCKGLTSLTLPSGVTKIGRCAFWDCYGLTSLTLPSGVTEIGYDAFKDCYGLTSLTLPSGVAEIKSGTFCDCSGLTSLSLPSGLTSIGESAFSGCSGLTDLTLPSGVTEIGVEAFSGCSGLTSLTLSSDIRIDGSAFKGCSGLKTVSFCINDDLETYLTKGHSYIYLDVDCAIKYYLGGEEITSIVIPSSVTTLGECAFQRCSTLQSVYVSWPTPISAGSAFLGVGISKCTLYVPQGTEQDYWLADVWGDFGNIVEYDPTGIDKVTTSTDAKELSRYSVNGQRLSAPAKGLNIVKYSDGSVKKVAVQ